MGLISYHRLKTMEQINYSIKLKLAFFTYIYKKKPKPIQQVFSHKKQILKHGKMHFHLNKKKY